MMAPRPLCLFRLWRPLLLELELELLEDEELLLEEDELPEEELLLEEELDIASMSASTSASI